MLRKTLLSLTLSIFAYITLSAQPNVLYCDLGDGWNDHNMNDRGVVMGRISQYTGSSSSLSFLFITQSGIWSPKWVGNSTDFNRTVNTFYNNGIYYYTGGGWDHDLVIPVTTGNYYTFITGKNMDSNNTFSVLETIFEPVNFSVTNVSETEITVGETVDVTVNLAGSIHVGEKVFIRYSTDNWVSSSFVEITDFTTNIGTGTIPAPANPGFLKFYVLSTNQTTLTHAEADFFTLRYDNNSGDNYSVTVNGSGDPTLTATPNGLLIEDQLDNRTISMSLSSETFSDNSIEATNIILNNAPAGLDIELISYTSETEIDLALSFDGTDFDTDISDFSISILGAELTGGNNLTSNTMNISAIDDQQSADSAFIVMWEGGATDIFYNINDFDTHNFGILGPASSLYLKSGQVYVWKNANGDITEAIMNYRMYEEGETPGVFIQQALPYHNEWAANAGTAQLWWNNTPDETNLNLLDEVNEGTYFIEIYFEAIDGNSNTIYLNNAGSNFIAQFTYEIPEDPIVVISPDAALQEENLNERAISITLTNTTFIDATLETSNFTLNNAPIGLSIESMSFIDNTHATLNLDFDGTDFEENINNFSITILSAEINTDNDITSNVLTIFAEDLTPHEGISYAKIALWEGDASDNFYMDDDFNGLDLGNFNASSSLYFKSGQVFTWKESTGNILEANMYYRFYKQGETPGTFNTQALPFSSESTSNDTTYQIWWNSGDDQNDINLLPVDITDGIYYIEVFFSVEIDDDITIMWNNNTNNYIAQFSYGSEPALQASVSIPMTETNLDDAIVTLNLLDDTFIDNDINPVNLVLNNAPTGLSIESINYIGSTQILALLAFDGTDFDTNITDFNVSINGSELTSGNNLTSNNLLITAINEDAGIWSHLITAENMEFTLGDNINPWINMEIGQTTWDGANIGYGLSNTDETTFTWINAEWYEDGEGNNKKVHAQINIQDNMSTGIYYYGGRAKATATSAWYYANNEIWAETTEFAPEYTITINPVPDPVSIEANALDGTRIQLNWTADSEYNNVIILAKEGSEISATPEQGTLYAINDVIDDATVIYKGSNSSFIHNNLNHLTSYYYKVFTINNNYYSNAIVANTTTTDEDGCTFDIFLGNDTAICGGTAILINPGLEVSPYGDSLTITYNATITGELIDAEKVYMHSGAEMAPDNGWEYVVGNWGDDDGIGLMTEIADNIWQITIVPVNYYQYPSAQSLYGIYMKFRNANGSIDAGDNAGDEIWLNMSIAPPIADFNAIEVNYIPSTISSITWSNNSHEPTLSIANSGEYWISATDMNGCVGQDTINIGIQPLPQVNIGNDTAFCTGGELLLYPGIFDAYHWQDNTTDTSIVVTIPGVYAVTITDEYGCQGFDVIVVQVVDPPTAMFSYTDLGNNTIEFVDESTNANTYAWDFDNDGDIDSDIAGNVQYTYPSIGQYGVSLTVENVCSDDIYSTTIMILSIEDILLGEINIYPNPVSEILQIETELFQSETIYKIIDLSGKTIYTTSASGNLTEIDVSKLANGYYILNIISSATSQSIRFVKQ